VNNVSGNDNTAMGFVSMNHLTSGKLNTGVGSYALNANSVGDGNTAVGQQSLQNTTNSGNTGIGSYSLTTNVAGTNNTALGSNADVVTNALTNATAIGYGAKVAASNTIQLGNTNVSDVKTNGAITGASFIKSGGTSSQFLKADGSVDSSTYLTTAGTATNVSGIVALANGGTGSATQNFVDITTAQTVAGAKTFSSDLNVNGKVIVGASSAASTSAVLEASSTTQGFLPPRMTTAQRNTINSPADGLIVFNTTSNMLNVFFLGNWHQLITTLPQGTLASLDASSPTNNGSLINGLAVSSASRMVSYTGGNGESHSGQTVVSTGVTGLTATLTSGNFAVGNGTLTYTITGTPSSDGTASFALNIGGQTATLTIEVATLAIGTSYQGGKIAYILQFGDAGYDLNIPRGLIAAASDQGTAEWGCIYTPIAEAQGEAIGTGNQNTIGIMNGCSTAGIAARICGDLVLNGYSDWYLPSKDELNKLYINRVAIGGFGNGSYWSSSEPNSYENAWYQYFQDGNQYYGPKNNLIPVRAIRSF
jgi:hypothetical protein